MIAVDTEVRTYMRSDMKIPSLVSFDEMSEREHRALYRKIEKQISEKRWTAFEDFKAQSRRELLSAQAL